MQRVIDGDLSVPVPQELLIHRICEEFSCLPSQAERELLDMDATLLLDVLAVRSYLRAKHSVETAKTRGDVAMTPAVRQVFEVQAALMKPRADS